MSELKVLVGAPCAKVPVYDKFYDAFAMLECPPGSIKMRATGGGVSHNLNMLIDKASEHKCSHLFIVEDDSTFAKYSLMRLLAHDKPVVTGLCRSRQAPFLPYIYSGLDPVQGLTWRGLTGADMGLIKVAATGMGGILINMDVFKLLERPYFRNYFIGEKEWGQDVIFGKSLIEAGVEVYCDLDVVIDHMTQCTIGSEFVDGNWDVVVKINQHKFNLVVESEVGHD